MKAYTIIRSPFSSKARHVGDPLGIWVMLLANDH